jgi:chloride channel protein, CIC family
VWARSLTTSCRATTANPGAYALVGMGAVFAGIIRVPLTSVFTILELTRDYSIVVPAMIANMVSFAISRELQPEPIYEALALQDGIHLPRPARERAESGIPVETVMQPNVPIVQATDLLNEIPSAAAGYVATVGNGHSVAFTSSELREWVRRHGASAPVSSMFVDALEYPHVHPDHVLEDGVERMEDGAVKAIVVLDRSDVHRVRGIVTLTDVRAAFRNRH